MAQLLILDVAEKSNSEFEKRAMAFASFILGSGATVMKSNANTDNGLKEIFFKNKDCEMVITSEGNHHAQAEASERGILTFEWVNRSKVFVPVKVIKRRGRGCTMFSLMYYSIKPNK